MKQSKTQKSFFLSSPVNKMHKINPHEFYSPFPRINADLYVVLWVQGLTPVEGLLGTLC